MLVSGIEVTERRRLEVEKERERAFLNAIANNAPSMLCLIDDEGRLTQGGANIAFERTLGYEPPTIGGQVLLGGVRRPGRGRRGAQRSVEARLPPASRRSEHDNTWVDELRPQRLSIAWTCTPLPEIDERTPLPDHRRRGHGAEAQRRSSAPRARASCGRARRGASSSGTSTTAPSSASWRSRSRCGSPSRARADRGGARGDQGAREELPRRSRSSASSPAESTGGAHRPRPAAAVEALASARPSRSSSMPGGALPARGRGSRVLRRGGVDHERRQVRAGDGDRGQRGPTNGVLVAVTDDGIGGADLSAGTGLRGLATGSRPSTGARRREPRRRGTTSGGDPAGGEPRRAVRSETRTSPHRHRRIPLRRRRGVDGLVHERRRGYPEAILLLRRACFANAVARTEARRSTPRRRVLRRLDDSLPAAAARRSEPARDSRGAWPGGLRVRGADGLHTGRPSLGEEGYTGIDVHRAARIGPPATAARSSLGDTLGALDGIAVPRPRATGSPGCPSRADPPAARRRPPARLPAAAEHDRHARRVR